MRTLRTHRSRTDDVHFVEILGGCDTVQILNGSGSTSWEHRPRRFHAVLSRLKRERNRLWITWHNLARPSVQASMPCRGQWQSPTGDLAINLIFIGAKTLRDIYNQNGSRRINAPNCNPHLLNLLVDAPLKPLTQTEQTEQTEQTSHAVLQLMQIACACGLVNLLQMVPVGFEKKTRGKKRPLYGKPPPFVPLRHSERSYHIMLQGCEMHSWVVRSPKIDTSFTIPLSGSNAVRILMRSTRKQQRADNLQI